MSRLRLSLPSSLATLAWMVGLIPLGFAAFLYISLWSAIGCDGDSCSTAATVDIAVWAVGCACWLLSVVLPVRKAMLAIATAGFAIPVCEMIVEIAS